MKIRLVPSIIAVAICALLAFGMYRGCRAEHMQLVVAICGGLSLLLTIGTILGVSFERSRTSINVKSVSGIFALLMLAMNIIFCCMSSFSLTLYVILNGLALLIWLLVAYSIVRTGENVN